MTDVIRRYSRRGKTVELREVTGVLAMKLPQDAPSVSPGKPIAAWQGGTWTVNTEVDVPSGIRSQWGAAGWHIVSKLDQEPADDLPSPLAVGSILRDPHNDWVIGTRRLTVRLRDELDEACAIESLARHSLKILQKLTFAPNLYEVSVSDDQDTFEVAADLDSSTECAYAEPQLIRNMGHR